MAKFFYIARDKKGEKITGVQESVNQDELIAWLQGKGLVVIKVAPEPKRFKAELKTQPSKLKLFKRKHLRISAKDLSLFCRQLATLLGAGITILEALVIISRQVSSQRFSDAINELKKNMEGGLSLHEAMAKSRGVFSPIWINLVESGEASGNLSIILSRLANYLERNAQFRAKIISALIYPAMLMAVGLGALVFLTVKIIPSFASLFSGFNMQLPFLTRVLIVTSNIVRQYLFFAIIATIVTIFFIRRYISRPRGRGRYENFLFRLPIFGDFFRNVVVERFSSEMSTLIESGVPILYALEISERSVNNSVVAEIIRDIKEDVKKGHSLSEPMEKSGFFDLMIVQMVRVGEEIGDLSGMFKKINSFYAEYVETFLVRFTSLFEPIMLVFIGAIIGIMVVGMFLPIFQISQIGIR